jgi:hypothetical protein
MFSPFSRRKVDMNGEAPQNRAAKPSHPEGTVSPSPDEVSWLVRSGEWFAERYRRSWRLLSYVALAGFVLALLGPAFSLHTAMGRLSLSVTIALFLILVERVWIHRPGLIAGTLYAQRIVVHDPSREVRALLETTSDGKPSLLMFDSADNADGNVLTASPAGFLVMGRGKALLVLSLSDNTAELILDGKKVLLEHDEAGSEES